MTSFLSTHSFSLCPLSKTWQTGDQSLSRHSDTHSVAKTHCAELTHVIRWVNLVQSNLIQSNPSQSIIVEGNQVNSPLNPGSFCQMLFTAFMLKLASSQNCLTQVRWWWLRVHIHSTWPSLLYTYCCCASKGEIFLVLSDASEHL